MKLFKFKKKNEKSKESMFCKKSYSQDGEDAVLSAFCSDVNSKGFYVDIGALHPLRFSNTQLFYEKGWNGLNIDATPGSMEEFNKIRTRDINLEVGISHEDGVLTYYLFEEPALNSFNEEISKSRIELGWKLKNEIPVKTMTINKILESNLKPNQQIDFINIDIEGLDYQVIKSLDFEKYAPKFFLIEELDYVEKDFLDYGQSEIYKLLCSKGYKVLAKTMRTVIYGRS